MKKSGMTTNKIDEEQRECLFDELIKMAQKIRKESEQEIPERDFPEKIILFCQNFPLI
ncbi:MAG: hypothetical protein KAU16_08480 [Methanophagales archaeon]|nr:hypothetical protein [Methanophagales archaeon]